MQRILLEGSVKLLEISRLDMSVTVTKRRKTPTNQPTNLK